MQKFIMSQSLNRIKRIVQHLRPITTTTTTSDITIKQQCIKVIQVLHMSTIEKNTIGVGPYYMDEHGFVASEFFVAIEGGGFQQMNITIITTTTTTPHIAK
jgi:hypothetical protein